MKREWPTKWQSYVFHEDKAFFVSTIRRDYETYGGIVWGDETLVWEWDPESKKRGKLLYQVDDHADCCEQLIRTGKYEEPDDE